MRAAGTAEADDEDEAACEDAARVNERATLDAVRLSICVVFIVVVVDEECPLRWMESAGIG